SWPAAESGSSNPFSPTPGPGTGADMPPSRSGPGAVLPAGWDVTPVPPHEPPSVASGIGSAVPPPSPGSVPRRPSAPPPMPRSAPSPVGSGGVRWEYGAGTGSHERPSGSVDAERAPAAVPPESAPIDVPPRPEHAPEPGRPSTMSDTGSFHLPPPQ